MFVRIYIRIAKTSNKGSFANPPDIRVPYEGGLQVIILLALPDLKAQAVPLEQAADVTRTNVAYLGTRNLSSYHSGILG